MRYIITFSFVCAWILYCMSFRGKMETDSGYLNITLVKAIVTGSLLIIPLCYFISLVFPSMEGW